MRINIGQEFVIGGFTPGSKGIDALVVGYYEGRRLIYAARVRAGLVPASRRELYERLKPLIVGNLPIRQSPGSDARALVAGPHCREDERVHLGETETRREFRVPRMDRFESRSAHQVRRPALR